MPARKPKKPHVSKEKANMTIYAVFDNGADVPNDIRLAMVDAANKQLQDFCKAWGVEPACVVDGKTAYYDPEDEFFGIDEPRSKDIVPVLLFPHPDVANAGGYHDVDPHGRAYCKVFTDPYLKNGGTWIDGKDAVSVALSHEILEAEGDGPANEWYLMPDGRLTAKEACDAVEDTFYNATTDTGRQVAVSNFLLPDWGIDKSEGPWDVLGLLKGPFEMTSGGYWLVSHAGKITQEFGSKFADWRKELKELSFRKHKRLKAHLEATTGAEISIFDPNTAKIDLDDPANRMNPHALLERGVGTALRAPTGGGASAIVNVSGQRIGVRASKPVNNSGQKLGKRKW